MKISKTKLSVLCSIIAVIAVFVCVLMVHADTGSNASGYFWSSNIGWISLNDCSNVADQSTCNPTASYGVTILPVAPGTISGYVWSSNIGWITFNSSGCPTSGCTPGAYVTWNNDGTGTVKGWARACSVYASGCSGSLKDDSSLGSWDGYIALDSGSAGGSAGSWGLTIGTDHTIGGYAWGSEVLGWIKSITGSVYLGGPTAQLAANPASIKKGDSSVLTVTATNIDGANSCAITPQGSTTAIAGLTMVQGTTGAWTGTVSVSPASTTQYTVDCTKSTQHAKASATVTVTYIITPGDCTTNPSDCCPPAGTSTNCAGGGGGSGGGGTGGYCAVDDPQFAWDSDGTSCTITEAGVGSRVVSASSQAEGGTIGTDGLYYVSIPLPVNGAGATYTFQCTGGSITTTQQVVVDACQKDYSITATPNAQPLVASTDGKTMMATFTVSALPEDGFTGQINLDMATWPSTIPASRTATFAPTSLTCDANGCSTSQLTISINTADIKQSDTYGTTADPMVIEGISGTLDRTADISVGATVKLKPIFNEF